MKTLAITCLSALALQVAIQINKTEPSIVEEITVCRSKRVASLMDSTTVNLAKDSLKLGYSGAPAMHAMH